MCEIMINFFSVALRLLNLYVHRAVVQVFRKFQKKNDLSAVFHVCFAQRGTFPTRQVIKYFLELLFNVEEKTETCLMMQHCSPCLFPPSPYSLVITADATRCVNIWVAALVLLCHLHPHFKKIVFNYMVVSSWLIVIHAIGCPDKVMCRNVQATCVFLK